MVVVRLVRLGAAVGQAGQEEGESNLQDKARLVHRYVCQTLHGSVPQVVAPVRSFVEDNLIVVLHNKTYLALLEEIPHF